MIFYEEENIVQINLSKLRMFHLWSLKWIKNTISQSKVQTSENYIYYLFYFYM